MWVCMVGVCMAEMMYGGDDVWWGDVWWDDVWWG